MSSPAHDLLRHNLRAGAPVYIRGAALLVITNALALSIPWLLRRAVDDLRAGQPLRQIGILAAAMAAVALAQALLRTASRMLILGYARRTAAGVRERLQAHLLRLPASFYDRARVGDLMSRTVNDLRSLRNFFGPGVLNLLNTTIIAAGALGMLLWLDVWLTLAALVVYPVFVTVVLRTVRQIHHCSRRAQERLADLTARVEQSIMGHVQIQAFSQEDHEVAAFSSLSSAYRRSNLELARARGRMVPMMGLLTGLGALVVLGFGGWQVARGDMTLGDFVAFTVVLGLLSGPIIALGWTLDLFQRGATAAARIQEVLDVPATAVQPPIRPTPARAAGRLTLRSVIFRYDSDGRAPDLKGVTLDIAPGEHVGIAGSVGSGKSTLLALLAGLYPPDSGTVLLDGRSLASWPRGTLRRSIVLASQEAFLFSRSLADNVRLGRPDLTREEIEEWLWRVAFDTDLAQFPAGIDTPVGERGLTLSGGQRQRVALARALAVEAPVVLLDDPLSMVDSHTEALALGRLREVLHNRTVLLASHRLTTLEHMERIVVLERGLNVEEGTPQELLARQGAYARLVLHGGPAAAPGGA
ncbi:MAG: ABC transporter ATP-binding protein [Acidobacteriota bacterium]